MCESIWNWDTVLVSARWLLIGQWGCWDRDAAGQSESRKWKFDYEAAVRPTFSFFSCCPTDCWKLRANRTLTSKNPPITISFTSCCSDTRGCLFVTVCGSKISEKVKGVWWRRKLALLYLQPIVHMKCFSFVLINKSSTCLVFIWNIKHLTWNYTWNIFSFLLILYSSQRDKYVWWWRDDVRCCISVTVVQGTKTPPEGRLCRWAQTHWNITLNTFIFH